MHGICSFLCLLISIAEWLALCENQPFGDVWSRLGRTMGAEDLAQKMLQGNPRERISAEDALLHKFFSPLPCQVHQLSDVRSIFTVPGLSLKPEIRDLFIPTQKGIQPSSHHKPW